MTAVACDRCHDLGKITEHRGPANYVLIDCPQCPPEGSIMETAAIIVPTLPRKGGWMQSSTGRQFWPLDPRPGDVCIEDIAHALAQEVRYGGHAPRPYTVAQHSVYVSIRASDLAHHVGRAAKIGLLHDAPEAFIKDIPSPMKRFIGEYAGLEAAWWAVIAETFRLPLEMPQVVLRADAELLATEKASLFPTSPAPWGLKYEPLDWKITPLGFDDAKQLFLNRWQEIIG